MNNILKKKICCPLCRGKGKIDKYYVQRYSESEVKKAKKLRKEGMSLRKIAEKIGVKHPWTVKNMISKK